jgi:hypothetical protein
MGQYRKPVNLDKHEFIYPHKLGTGLKLWEQLANAPGTGAALIVLTAALPETRGGGDFDLEENWHGPERTFPEHDVTPGPMPEDYAPIAQRTIGRWAGDRIALIGDYAEDGDLGDSPVFQTPKGNDPLKLIPASKVYGLCTDEPTNEDPERQAEIEALGGAWKDITDDVALVIEHELNGKFEGEGWRNWKPTERKRA